MSPLKRFSRVQCGLGVRQARRAVPCPVRVWLSVGSCGRTLANPLLTLLTRHQVVAAPDAYLYGDGVATAGWVTAGWLPRQRPTVAGSDAQGSGSDCRFCMRSTRVVPSCSSKIREAVSWRRGDASGGGYADARRTPSSAQTSTSPRRAVAPVSVAATAKGLGTHQRRTHAYDSSGTDAFRRAAASRTVSRQHGRAGMRKPVL